MMSIWTVVVLSMAVIIIKSNHANTLNISKSEARDYFLLNMFYRKWVSKMGGVYVPFDKATLIIISPFPTAT